MRGRFAPQGSDHGQRSEEIEPRNPQAQGGEGEDKRLQPLDQGHACRDHTGQELTARRPIRGAPPSRTFGEFAPVRPGGEPALAVLALGDGGVSGRRGAFHELALRILARRRKRRRSHERESGSSESDTQHRSTS